VFLAGRKVSDGLHIGLDDTLYPDCRTPLLTIVSYHSLSGDFGRNVMKIRVMVAALGFVGGLPLISTNLFAQEVPPTRVPVGPPARFSPGNYSLPHAAVPAVRLQSAANGGVQISFSYDGIDFNGSNCDCLPPDTNAAVSNSFVVETVNVQLTQYQYAQKADQPGGDITVFPNTTTTQVHYHLGRLVTAMASATASDGFVYPKGLYYQINVNGGRPRLLKQGVIDPGPGVAVQMPSVVEDQQGNLGVTWMESSSSEYLSMWVGNLYTNGTLSTQPVAPGGGFFFASFRIGDYSTAVLDPSDNRTFWAANEYIGPNGGSDIWRTHITSFSAKRVPQHGR
jgi:hypothetical protein